MSYDFRLCLPQPGRTREEIATADAPEEGATAPVPAKEERKRRVAAALRARNPALTPFAFGIEEIAKFRKITVEEAKREYRHIELNGPDNGNGIQIMLFDDEASVTVPYWHQGAVARQVFEEIWSYLKIIEREGGFFTYDPQLGRVLDLGKDFRPALEAYDKVSRDMASRYPANAAGAGATTVPKAPPPAPALAPSPPQSAKRWWEFWK